MSPTQAQAQPQQHPVSAGSHLAQHGTPQQQQQQQASSGPHGSHAVVHQQILLQTSQQPPTTATPSTLRRRLLQSSSSNIDFGVGRRALRTASTKPFKFCSVFKFEARKGWDALLAAYLQVKMRMHSTLLGCCTTSNSDVLESHSYPCA
jgi:hypothetical protein